MKGSFNLAVLTLVAFFFVGCKKDEAILQDSGYPSEIGRIMLSRCATPGCHTDQSKDAASGLSLETWEKLFEGTRNGAAVIPYYAKQSSMFMFCNTFPDLGVSLLPTMPVNGDALSRADVEKIRDWINKGAPRFDGKIMFADNKSRSKYYVANQGCDIVTVFDAASDLPMRIVEVGVSEAIEAPHGVLLSPDEQYWYVVFAAGSVVQKFRTSDDSFVGEIVLGQGSWNTLWIEKDGKTGWAADLASNGRIYYLDFEKLSVLKKYQGNNLFYFPHGMAKHPTKPILYVTSALGRNYYKVNMDTTKGNSPLDPEWGLPIIADGSTTSLDVHEIYFTPDGKQYITTCQRTNDVRMYDSETDKLLSVIPTGKNPNMLSFSESKGLAFVTCMEDSTSFPGKKGAVSIIDYKNRTLLKTIYAGHQPHGITVDEARGFVYVASRNFSADGPAPHHKSECDGRNGYVSYIDLNTLELVSSKRVEVSVDPYFVTLRK